MDGTALLPLTNSREISHPLVTHAVFVPPVDQSSSTALVVAGRNSPQMAILKRLWLQIVNINEFMCSNLQLFSPCLAK